jgi:predicted nucleic acid-binding protein
MRTTTEIPRFVIDASVVTKWHLRDEQHVEHADQILNDYLEGRIHLTAPDHLRYEVPSTIRKCVRTRRLTNDQARSAIEVFLKWQIPTVGDDDLILTAFDQIVRFNGSLYDGLYIALSDATQYPLIHADDRLHRAIDDRVAGAIWIEDWRSQPR